jgi:hypothetical protein
MIERILARTANKEHVNVAGDDCKKHPISTTALHAQNEVLNALLELTAVGRDRKSLGVSCKLSQRIEQRKIPPYRTFGGSSGEPLIDRIDIPRRLVVDEDLVA